MDTRNVLIIIPAYNEQESILGVITNLKKIGFGKILIINDGSVDNTYQLIQKAECRVINHKVNMGLGSALTTGINYAAIENYDFVITFDADGQMQATDAKRVYEKAQEGYDFVYGCRNFDAPSVPKMRKVANFLADTLTTLLSGKYVWDTQSGLRCIKVDLLRKFSLKSRGYSVSSELVVESIRNSIVPEPVKIDAIYTKESLRKGQKISNSFRVVKELLG